MNRNNLLVLGMGQCGNVMAESTKMFRPIYSTAYINSSYGDVKNLKFATKGNTFIFNGADGSGSNRELANEFANNDEMRLGSFFMGFAHFQSILIYVGMGGGTGSGSLKKTVETIKKVIPHIVINVIGIIPSLREGDQHLKNALGCVSDIAQLMENGLINDLKFVNNNSRENTTQINKEVITLIDKEYTMTGTSAKFGTIDSNDLSNVTTSQGYGTILELPDEDLLFDEALRIAKKSSVFVVPERLRCSYAAVNVTDRYDLNVVCNEIESEHTIYTTLNKSNKDNNPRNPEINLIALGGCETPLDPFYDIEKELKNRDANRIKTKKTFKFSSDFTKQSNINEDTSVKKNETKNIQDESLEELFDVKVFDFDLD